jgi:hypothetical protein
MHRQLTVTLAALRANQAARNRHQAARARHDMRTWQVERRKRAAPHRTQLRRPTRRPCSPWQFPHTALHAVRLLMQSATCGRANPNLRS